MAALQQQPTAALLKIAGDNVSGITIERLNGERERTCRLPEQWWDIAFVKS